MKGHQLNGPVPHTHVQVLLLWCRVHGTWSHADMSDLRQNEEGAMFIEAVTHSHTALAQKKAGFADWAIVDGNLDPELTWWSQLHVEHGAYRDPMTGLHDAFSRLSASDHAGRCTKSGHNALVILMTPAHPQYTADFRRAHCPAPHCVSDQHVAFVRSNGELCEGLVVLCMSHPPTAATAMADHTQSPWKITGVLLGGEKVPGYGSRNQEQA